MCQASDLSSPLHRLGMLRFWSPREYAGLKHGIYLEYQRVRDPDNGCTSQRYRNIMMPISMPLAPWSSG